MKRILTLTGVAALLPAVAFAQSSATVGTLLQSILDILNFLVPVGIALAVVYFIYGVAKYIMASGDEEAQRNARGVMIWGIIAIFVIVSLWGFVEVLQNTFVDSGTAGTTPIPTQIN